MGLYQSPVQAEGLFPVMVLNMILWLVMLRDLIRSVLRFVGVVRECSSIGGGGGEGRRVWITKFKSDMGGNSGRRDWRGGRDCGSGGSNSNECCCSVCLCGFECGEVVSELSCKHFFHRGCLEKWFCNNGGNATCPLCRSVM